MKKILLTSTGLSNVHIKDKFLELLDVKIEDTKVLFIITAANNPDAIRMLPACLSDLTDLGILDQNITVYNMHELISHDEIYNYDVVYVCGGETAYLVKRINEVNFKEVIDRFVDNGGIYLGVSAGSVAAGTTYEGGLRLIDNKIKVHTDEGSSNGIITNDKEINLTNNQAIYISENDKVIFE